MRDTDHYADPDVFRPERFFEIAQDSEFVTWDPKKLVFSFGRRSVLLSTSLLCSCTHSPLKSVPRCASRR